MPIPVGQAIRRTSADPVDETLTLTKAEMRAVNDDLMPDKYFTVCKDDGKFYLFNKANDVDQTTGKFREFSGGGTVDQSYDATSTNAQSGTAVAEAVAAADRAKVLWNLEQSYAMIQDTTSGVDIGFSNDNANLLRIQEYAPDSRGQTQTVFDMELPNKTYVDGAVADALATAATDTTLGTIKLNSAESVTVDSDGKLKVGGRLGQMPTTTGIYAPNTIQPAAVGDGSFLITEASGTTVGGKTLAVTTGAAINIRATTSPDQTEYHVQNTYENRIKCAALAFSGSVATLNESTAKSGHFVNVLSVKIKGSSYIPDSSADILTPDADIIIKTDA